MLATFARGSVLLFLAAMIVAWALSLAQGGDNARPNGEQTLERLYS